mgnify:CR=1 FL=1
MKTKLHYSRLFAGVAMALGTGVVMSTAVAGPGPDYWRNPGKAPSTAAVAPVAPMTHANAACTDARVVSVTETKFIQANSRGPTRTVEVGKKLVCTSCDTPMIVMKPSGNNARGAMAPVEIRGTHECSKNGCAPTISVVRAQ